MADTARTLDAFLNASTGLFKDNTAGDISAQDLRDYVLSAYQPQGICDFRLGLEDGVYVSTSDQTSKSNVYLNPGGRGNRLCLSDGTSLLQITVPKLALGGLTGLTSARNYDVFSAYSTPTHSSTNTATDVVTWTANPGWTTGTYVIVTSTGGGLVVGTDYWYNAASTTTGSFHTSLANAIAGANKVDLTGNVTQTLIGVFADLGPTWNTGGGSDTARGTGAGSTALTTLNGVNVNAVSVTGSIGGGTIAAAAGIYLGTVRTTGTTTVEDSAGGSTTQVGGKRFVWNHYNRVPRHLAVFDSTDTWSYTTNTWRQSNGASGNKVEYVTGDSSVTVEAHAYAMAFQASGATRGPDTGIGVDSTSSPSGMRQELFSASATGVTGPTAGGYRGQPGLGYHYLAWLEKGGDGTSVFVGDNGATIQAGMYATVWG